MFGYNKNDVKDFYFRVFNNIKLDKIVKILEGVNKELWMKEV